MAKGEAQYSLPTHGASVLPSVVIDSYNLEIEDTEGFVGDKARTMAFSMILDDLRASLRKSGRDPLGKTPSDELSQKKLDAALKDGSGEVAAVVQSAIEEFSQQLAGVIRRYMRLKSWRETQAVVVGGGFSKGRVGELVVGRTAVILKSEGTAIDLQPIMNDPNEAGLIGAVHLLPAWMLAGHESLLAVDIGGNNIRCGVVTYNINKAKDLSKAHVDDMKLWRHGEEEKLGRDAAVDELVAMLKSLLKNHKGLAPVIGIGCPGVINADGTIDRGAQNLPGDWEHSKFNLALRIREKIPQIGDEETLVVMHNDAVVQGLSELPRMQERKRWGVLTIGTGLGNARFSNREKE